VIDADFSDLGDGSDLGDAKDCVRDRAAAGRAYPDVGRHIALHIGLPRGSVWKPANHQL
jgi:hypothetical protein